MRVVAVSAAALSEAILKYEEWRRDWDQAAADADYAHNQGETDPLRDPNRANRIYKDCYHEAASSVNGALSVPGTSLNMPLDPETTGLPGETSENIETANKLRDAGQKLGEPAEGGEEGGRDASGK